MVVASHEVGLETLYLAKQEGMINGDFAFILFELNQGFVNRRMNLQFLWFTPGLLRKHRFVQYIRAKCPFFKCQGYSGTSI